jgi:hypothetical protein
MDKPRETGNTSLLDGQSHVKLDMHISLFAGQKPFTFDVHTSLSTGHKHFTLRYTLGPGLTTNHSQLKVHALSRVGRKPYFLVGYTSSILPDLLKISCRPSLKLTAMTSLPY